MESNSPNFLIVGCMKSGTSALSRNINKHSDVYCLTNFRKRRITELLAGIEGFELSSVRKGMSKLHTKELDFFNDDVNFALGKDHYEKYFPKEVKAIGESSPNYTQPHVIEKSITNIKSLYPNMKIIYVMRDPINRAFSHYNMVNNLDVDNMAGDSWKKSIKGVSFDTVVSRQEEYDPNGSGIFRRGKHYDVLQKLIAAFGKENIHVIIQETMKDDQFSEINKVYQFLGVDQVEERGGIEYKDSNVGDYKDRVLSQEAIDDLKLYYASDVTQLKNEYPDLDYSKWNTY
tara:strand:- start:301 stop:1164 length:864 start_codon:yes stop_codon:yes gene_type:complete